MECDAIVRTGFCRRYNILTPSRKLDVYNHFIKVIKMIKIISCVILKSKHRIAKIFMTKVSKKEKKTETTNIKKDMKEQKIWETVQ